jgi:single-stranded DNA-binding protein
MNHVRLSGTVRHRAELTTAPNTGARCLNLVVRSRRGEHADDVRISAYDELAGELVDTIQVGQTVRIVGHLQTRRLPATSGRQPLTCYVVADSVAVVDDVR